MLDQVIHWVVIAATVLEGLLLFRVLALKLHRVYAFLTLYCALNFLFDAAKWWLGLESQQSHRIDIYSLYVFAAVYPLAAWDVFEEIKSQAAALRRAHAPRLVSGIFVTLLLLIVYAWGFDPKNETQNGGLLPFAGVLLFSGSTTTCLLFLAFVYRSIRAQKIATSNNTFVWTVFIVVSLIMSFLDCVILLVGTLLKGPVIDVSLTVLNSCDILLMIWCILKLKALPSDLPTAPEKVAQ